MPRKKQTYFDTKWLNDDIFKGWLKRGSTNTTFKCKVCKDKKNERVLGDMGVQALKKHLKSTSHQDNYTSYLSTFSFFKADQQQSASASDVISVDPIPIADPIPSMLTKTSKTEAEIIYALHCVKQGYSDNSLDDFSDIMSAMFTDSTTAKEITLGRSKVKYVVNHGLYPYFKDLLKEDVSKAPYLVVMFDESLNKSLQRSEMDIMMRFWSDEENKVRVRYWDSSFLGHTTHQDLLKNFNDGLAGVDISKLLQVSMDGPNTNHCFLSKVKDQREKDELSALIDIGTCSLHTVHGAFATGAKMSGWDLKKVLKGCYIILHDTPARREDYFSITGSTVYPLAFCSTRWVEDKSVADRLITLWPNMMKIFEFWNGLSKSKQPKCKSYLNVKDKITDKLYVAKLHFFSYVAGLMEPYLTCLQGDEPMVPYLCGDAKRLYKAIMQVIVKPSVLSSCTSAIKFLNVDLGDDQNILPVKDIHLGFGAENVISGLLSTKSVEVADVTTLRKEAKEFIVAICEKLEEKNPMSSVIVRCAACFDPALMLKCNQDYLNKLLKSLVHKIVSSKIITFSRGDKALSQYKDLLEKDMTKEKEKFLKFDRKEGHRLDLFFFHDIRIGEKYPELAAIVKIILTLSHGQASVERGFNDNNIVLKDNHKSDSVVARRFIKNYLSEGGLKPHTVLINTQIIRSVKGAWRRYNEHLEEERDAEKKKEKNSELVQLENERNNLQTQCDDLQKTITGLESKFVDFAKKAEKTNQMQYLIEGNALKRKSEEKAEVVLTLKRRIEELDEKRKKMKFR